MRQVGTLSNEADAARFAGYLHSLGIRTQVDPEPEGWSIWIIDEDHVAKGREELAAFSENRGDPKYSAQAPPPETAKPKPRVVNLRDRWATPRGRQPLVTVLTAICILVAVYQMMEPKTPLTNRFLIAPGIEANAEPGPYPAPRHLAEVRQGEVWRLITPILLHFGLLHIFFNMVWLQTLGNAIEFRRGTWAMTGLVLAVAVVSNLAQYEVSVLLDKPYPGNFGGMSGVNYGLFGYLWVKTRFDPAAGLAVSRDTTMWMMLWLVLCMTGLVGPIANTAHIVGLLVGGAIAYVPVAFRRT
jgi:GlpG protein